MKRKHFFIFLVIVFAILPYANIFNNDFVWDDKKFIEDNLKIRSLEGIPNYFLEDDFDLYRPLRTVLYAFTYSIWKDNVFGYHLNSVFWHVLVSVLVFFIIKQLTKHEHLPLVAAIIFAVHPIHVERVTNMTGGFDLMGIFFILLAFYLYILFSQKKDASFFTYSMISFVLALFSSEEAFVFPFIILLYELIFNNLKFDFEKTRKKLSNLSILFGTAILFALFRFFVIGLGARADVYPTGNFFTTILTMLKVFLYYVYLIFIPYPLTLYRQIETSIFDPMVVFSFLVLSGLIFIGLKLRKKYRLASFAIGWFFITLLPFSNIFPLNTLMADRYVYLASFSASLVYAFLIFFILKKKNIALLVSALLVGLFLFTTLEANRDWKDDITLWEETSKKSQHSTVFSNLGFAYEKANRIRDAEIALNKAIETDFSNEQAHYNLGIVYLRQGNYERAANQFTLAINNAPEYARAYDSLGLAYYYLFLEGRKDLLEKAEESFEMAIRIDPGDYKAYNDMGIVKAQQGNFTDAIEFFEFSLRLNPWSSDTYYNLGKVYDRIGEENKAKLYFERSDALQT